MSQKIVAVCGSCSGQFRLDATFAGATIQCPNCSQPIHVPANAPAAPATIGPTQSSPIGGGLGQTQSVPIGGGLGQTGTFSTPVPPTQVALPNLQQQGIQLPTEQPAGAPPPQTPKYDSGHAPAYDDQAPARPSVAPPNRGNTTSVTPPNRNTTSSVAPPNRGNTASVPPPNRNATRAVAPPKREEPVPPPRTQRRAVSDIRAAAGTSGRRTQMRSSDRYSAPTGADASKKKNQTILIVTISGAAVLLVLVLALALGGGKGDDERGNGNVVAGNDESATDSDSGSGSDLERKVKMMTEDCRVAPDLPARMQVLGKWRVAVDHNQALEEPWKKLVLETVREQIGRVEASDVAASQKTRDLEQLAIWVSSNRNNCCNRPDLAADVWGAVVALDPQNEKANKALGHVRYQPEDELIQRADTDAEGAKLLGELEQYVGKYWSDEKMQEIRAIEQRVISKLRDHFSRVDNDPFFAMALQEKSRLERLTTFAGFDFDVVIIKPWVLLITKEGNTRQLFDRRRKVYEDLLVGTWSEWKRLIQHWGLQSSIEGDSLENPRPFVAVGFATQESYLEYQEQQERFLSPSTRAFYDPNNRTVNFYESEEGGIGVVYDDDATLVHECSHQIMDRYTQGGCLDYKAHVFTEGYPEYVSYFKGTGLNMKFGGEDTDANIRHNSLTRLHTYFNGKRKPIPGQLTDDDWVFFDVPMLLTLPDSTWTHWIGGKYLFDYIYESDYWNRRIVRQWLSDDPRDFFHSVFYAFAWSFVYWLHQEYPREFDAYARTAMNTGRGPAEVFCRCFNITPARQLPDLDYWCGENNSLLRANSESAFECWLERVEILRNTPKIAELHKKWVDWMRRTFPVSEELDNADLDAGPGEMLGGGEVTEESIAAATAELEERADLLIEIAAEAVLGDADAIMVFQLLIFTYLQRGVPIEKVNEILGRGNMELDMNTLRPVRK